MQVTRNVILDLLPLYLAGEASPDTQALVENYLETDKELAEAAKLATAMNKREGTPLPITREAQMQAYKQAQKRILQRTVLLGTAIAFGILAILGLALLRVFVF
jgi:anti-sigma factor RsiW